MSLPCWPGIRLCGKRKGGLSQRWSLAANHRAGNAASGMEALHGADNAEGTPRRQALWGIAPLPTFIPGHRFAAMTPPRTRKRSNFNRFTCGTLALEPRSIRERDEAMVETAGETQGDIGSKQNPATNQRQMGLAKSA